MAEEDLEVSEDFNLDAGGDFIAMAAQLIYIKSLTLLPSPPENETLEDGMEYTDPREELSNMLIEYQKVKELASFLDNRPVLGRDVFDISISHPEHEEISAESPEIGPGNNLNELFDANIFILSEYFYYKIKEASTRINLYKIEKENFSIKDKIIEIMEMLGEQGLLLFSGTMPYKGAYREGYGETAGKLINPGGLGEAVSFFLAILEMSRLVLINLDQVKPFSEINISLYSKSVINNYRSKISSITS